MNICIWANLFILKNKILYIFLIGHKIENSISEAISGSNAVLIITGHNEFDNFDIELLSNSMSKPILVDCTGKINPQSVKSKGIIFRGIGRGDL